MKIKKKNVKPTDKYYTLIPFVFQILCLLFYFEILELNFCKLNYNTVKNIQEREKLQDDPKNESTDFIANNNIKLYDQYYLDHDEHKDKDEETDDIIDDNKINDDKLNN